MDFVASCGSDNDSSGVKGDMYGFADPPTAASTSMLNSASSSGRIQSSESNSKMIAATTALAHTSCSVEPELEAKKALALLGFPLTLAAVVHILVLLAVVLNSERDNAQCIISL